MNVAEHLDVLYGPNKLVELNVEPGDDVLVVTSPDQDASIPQAIAGMARLQEDCDVAISIHSDHMANDAPRPVKTAAAEADVVFMATKAGTGYSDAVDKGLENNGKVVLCFLRPEQLYRGAITGDYPAVRERAKRIRQALNAGREVHVTTEMGTDVRFELNPDRDILLITGIASQEDNGGFTGALAGEAHVAPEETSVNGTIVVDISAPAVDEYGEQLIGLVDEPIELTVEDGRVIDVSGGSDARTLADILDSATAAGDVDAKVIAEFGLGANPNARFLGSGAEDKKRLGTAHFAVGDNQFAGKGSRFAGNNESGVHIDHAINEPTVRVDGNLIMDQGDLLL